ncbi:bile acid:sodium symporter family protein [Devosia sp.]|uniref:bile acid:sodium symporter family protein n=1 Tax=Devosia sp. TaxID=1871048 RepID=UPI001AD3E041|nr:bile acid:sodium symporter family protein [Devosia sp.]MBN9333168.1 bile acid:sodium symporter [Devosia sp.]
MSFAKRLKRFGFDYYLFLLLGTVVLASLWPASGVGADIVDKVAYVAVALLFFLYGAKLNTSAIVAGIANWRLQGLVFGFTYVVFPICGLALAAILSPWIEEELAIGIVYLSILPSTVQSSIAFTSIARGNVPAAVCAASMSNVLGVFLTPALVAVLLHASGDGISFESIMDIGLQILAPFIIGQLLRPLVGVFISRHTVLTQVVDRGSILIIVYSAFSAGVIAGIWDEVGPVSLAIIIAANIVLLAVVMVATIWAGRAAGLNHADRLTLLFCGSKKSLASGLPMANILFAGQAVSMIILPLMLFHQIQLFVCAIIAQRAGYLASESELQPAAS